MKLTGKMVVIYLLAGLVPVMIILGITYMEMKKILWDRETTILESYVSQTTDSMDNELEIYNNLSKYISYNQSIAKILRVQCQHLRMSLDGEERRQRC